MPKAYLNRDLSIILEKKLIFSKLVILAMIQQFFQDHDRYFVTTFSTYQVLIVNEMVEFSFLGVFERLLIN